MRGKVMLAILDKMAYNGLTDANSDNDSLLIAAKSYIVITGPFGVSCCQDWRPTQRATQTGFFISR